MIDLKKLLLVLSLFLPFLSAQQTERPARGQRPDRQQVLERLHAAQGRLQNLQQRLEQRLQQQGQGQAPQQQRTRSGMRGPGAGMRPGAARKPGEGMGPRSGMRGMRQGPPPMLRARLQRQHMGMGMQDPRHQGQRPHGPGLRGQGPRNQPGPGQHRGPGAQRQPGGQHPQQQGGPQGRRGQQHGEQGRGKPPQGRGTGSRGRGRSREV